MPLTYSVKVTITNHTEGPFNFAQVIDGRQTTGLTVSGDTAPRSYTYATHDRCHVATIQARDVNVDNVYVGGDAVASDGSEGGTVLVPTGSKVYQSHFQSEVNMGDIWFNGADGVIVGLTAEFD